MAGHRHHWANIRTFWAIEPYGIEVAKTARRAIYWKAAPINLFSKEKKLYVSTR